MEISIRCWKEQTISLPCGSEGSIDFWLFAANTINLNLFTLYTPGPKKPARNTISTSSCGFTFSLVCRVTPAQKKFVLLLLRNLVICTTISHQSTHFAMCPADSSGFKVSNTKETLSVNDGLLISTRTGTKQNLCNIRR